MRILILFVFLALFSCKKETAQTEVMPIDIHNSQISLDVAGTYIGLIPCADCEGISVIIILNCDKTFELNYRYIGKSDEYFSCSGEYAWNESGNSIILNCDNFPNFYFVGENHLIMLDMDGNRISSELANKYILTKTE